jgi:hypothetical protein
MVESGKYLFMPKEIGQELGTWCVMMEPVGGGVSIFDRNIFSIDLEEPTFENASALADYLNDTVAQLRVTYLSK